MIRKITYSALGESLEFLPDYNTLLFFNPSEFRRTQTVRSSTITPAAQNGTVSQASYFTSSNTTFSASLNAYIYGNANRPVSQVFDVWHRKITRIFNPGITGKLQILTDIAAVESYGRPLAPPVFGDIISGTQTFTVELYHDDPFLHNTARTQHRVFSFPEALTIPQILPFTLPGELITGAVVNNGDVESPLEITITGAVKNPRIINITTGDEMIIELSSSPEDIIKITTTPNAKHIYLNDKDMITRTAAGSVFFSLQRGENIIRIIADYIDAAVTAAVSFSENYIGV